ncbi:hypothetical protein PGB34_00775 [Xenophilus arseniciresistens]|uniref:Uncharacterized protein n=1 Tax=Xenophilus arseniciresistens TaxID=1283306 RepID=A0AAE3N7W0_9BURK|nr:hypothetical protein [Xenophilus arseniciresistens]MDA7414884.1 hypothetical protein [Xenophilus arseniciresistens]
MAESDHQEMFAQHQARMREIEQDELRAASTRIQEFKAYARTRGVQLSDAAFNYSPPLGVTASAPGVLRSLLDVQPNGRDGLYGWNELAKVLRPGPSEGCLKGPDFIAMAHPSFRRQMHPHGNWAPRFIDLFWSFNSLGLDKSVALDEDRVRVDLDGMGYGEFDTWYGPPFNDDIASIGLGNVKLRPPSDLSRVRVEMFFASAYCIDIKWSQSGNIKTFQALELKDESVLTSLRGVPHHPARYLHAEFDLAKGVFRHFDGAIQYLTSAEYFARRDSDFNMTYKHTWHVKPTYQKVFKLNGTITTKEWVELSSHFFAANPLMFEYFNGDYPGHISDIVEKLRALPEEQW